MPKFRFEFIESTAQPAIQVDMENLDAAKAEAKRAAKEAMLDGIVEGVDPTSWVTRIYDEAGIWSPRSDSRTLWPRPKLSDKPTNRPMSPA
ncbi:hypothetical protein [Mesorhizobium sp.]|uniref:DUF6894 family protein n=1 Tax=Mesorhizobium sp. TaxID=1871066 RepID=UPI0025BB1491|nr:hypothetical protein [Mesorhizobium sp.]